MMTDEDVTQAARKAEEAPETFHVLVTRLAKEAVLAMETAERESDQTGDDATRVEVAIRQAVAWSLERWLHGHVDSCDLVRREIHVGLHLLRWPRYVPTRHDCTCGYDAAQKGTP